MLQSILAIVAHEDGNWYFDNFGEAALYALIGLMVVFVGIVIIIAIIWLIGLLMRKTNNLEFLTKKRQHKNKTVKKAEGNAASQDEEIPDEVKAAIIAAIMAYYQQKEEKCEFTVKRIKRL